MIAARASARPDGVEHGPTLRLRAGIAAATLVLIALNGVGTATRAAPVEWPAFVSDLLVGSVMVGAGVSGWTRRPQSRIGPLLVIAGLLYLIGALQWTDWVVPYTAGFLVHNTFGYPLAHAVLTFPTGRASDRLERVLLTGLYGAGLLLLGERLIEEAERSCPGCLMGLDARTTSSLADALLVTASAGLVFLSAAFMGVIARNWRRGSAAARRALLPLLVVGVLGALTGIVEAGAELWSPSLAARDGWFLWLRMVLMLLVPLAFLEGLLRTRLSRAAVGDLVIELGAEPMHREDLVRALARRMGDPSLEIAYVVSDGRGYVDASGFPRELPGEGSGRAVAVLESEGRSIAALVHDETLAHDPEIVEAVAAAARLAIANERLRAELRAQLEEVRASRARIVDAGDAERRKVQRDLHDGAQQRLVTLSLELGLIRNRLDEGTDPEIAAQLESIGQELREAIDELRELARGIHPSILTDSGLAAALESLAQRSALPVSLDNRCTGRLPERVEVTAYFVVAEALTNVAKYAQASRVVVRLESRDGMVRVEVDDDGNGGADPGSGSGLSGLQDRVAAIGGQLWVESPPGEGTQVWAEIPVAGSKTGVDGRQGMPRSARSRSTSAASRNTA
jgi:signal transduction histidine kinase